MQIGVAKKSDEPILVTRIQDGWIDFTAACTAYYYVVKEELLTPPADLLQSIANGFLTPELYRKVIDCVENNPALAAVILTEPPQLMMPYRPGKIVAIGRNYKAHVAEFDNKMPKEPIFFAKSPTACIGPEEPIVVQDWYGRVDHEGELGVVIGKRAKNVLKDKAYEHIFGYTLVNDVTAREMQKADIADAQPWYRSKNLDTFCPWGPVITLRDAVDWPVDQDIQVRVNGEVRQQSHTSKFIFDIATVIEAVSRFMTLEPGDIISTGTPEGVSPLHPGDVVEVEMPGLGLLRNPVMAL